jgi:chromosome segregation ATPase
MENLKKDFLFKNSELEDLNKKLLRLQDEKLDIEAKLENREGKEHLLREEIVVLQDVIKGKDTAISQLSANVLNTTNENCRLSEMVQSFKDQLIFENCFSK